MATGEWQRELCTACGFDSDLYGRQDTITSQHVIPSVLAAAVEGLQIDALGRRPDAGVWSIGEYLDHVREVTFGNRFCIEVAISTPGKDLGAAPDSPISVEPAAIEVAATLAAIDEEFRAIQAVLGGLDDAGWASAVIVDGKETPVNWFARHVLHDALHHLGDIGAIRAQLGHGPLSSTGSLAQISTSAGGVPKFARDMAVVSPAGVEGDHQSDRRHHGRPVQAVCLWSADVIAALVDEGHPIAAGNAGENLTLAGIDWASLRPGSRIEVGDVPMLVTAHAVPCAKNAQWFSDRDSRRILHDQHPGWSRLYAIPLGKGTVRVGDEVSVG